MAELAVTQARGQAQIHPLEELREARLALGCAQIVLGILQDQGIVPCGKHL